MGGGYGVLGADMGVWGQIWGGYGGMGADMGWLWGR